MTRLARSLAELIETVGARRREDSLRVATSHLVGGNGRPDLLLAVLNNYAYAEYSAGNRAQAQEVATRLQQHARSNAGLVTRIMSRS